MIVLGIDVGITGGFAWVDDTRQLLKLEDMPCVALTSGGKSRHEVSPAQVIAMLHTFHRADFAVIEEPSVHMHFSRNKLTGERTARTPGAKSQIALGDNFGVLRTCCIAVGISVRRVAPGVWKRSMGVSADKNESRRLAQEMFPGWAMHFAKVKDDGRAEAALLAVYGLSNR